MRLRSCVAVALVVALVAGCEPPRPDNIRSDANFTGGRYSSGVWRYCDEAPYSDILEGLDGIVSLCYEYDVRGEELHRLSLAIGTSDRQIIDTFLSGPHYAPNAGYSFGFDGVAYLSLLSVLYPTDSQKLKAGLLRPSCLEVIYPESRIARLYADQFPRSEPGPFAGTETYVEAISQAFPKEYAENLMMAYPALQEQPLVDGNCELVLIRRR